MPPYPIEGIKYMETVDDAILGFTFKFIDKAICRESRTELKPTAIWGMSVEIGPINRDCRTRGFKAFVDDESFAAGLARLQLAEPDPFVKTRDANRAKPRSLSHVDHQGLGNIRPVLGLESPTTNEQSNFGDLCRHVRQQRQKGH